MFGNRKAMVEMPAESAGAGGGGVVYAGFWARFAAVMVDSAIVTVVGVALMVVLFMVMGGAGVLIGNIAFFILQLLYWPVMESSARQATFGKSLMGLEVTDLQGNRTSFIKSLVRNLAKILSSLIMMIGFLLAAFTARKQGLHDMLAGCLVVRTGPSSLLKAVVATVVALAIAGYGAYYYVTQIYMPQAMSEMKGTVDHHDKVAREMPKSAPAPKPAPAATPSPQKSTPAPVAAGSQEIDKLLATPLSGIDKPSSARAGAGIVHLDTQFNDSFWLRVLMPPLPGLERGRVSVTIDRVLDTKGIDHYDSGSSFEKGSFLNVKLSPEKTGVPHFSGKRSVRVTKGTAKPDVQKVDGVLHLELPVNIQQATAKSADVGKELPVGPIKATVKSFEGDKVSLTVSGDPDNFLGATGYDAQGVEVPIRSTAKGGSLYTYSFGAPVARVELFAATELLKRDYPFTVTRGGTAAAAASAPVAVAAADKPAAVAAAPSAVTPPPAPAKAAAKSAGAPAAPTPVVASAVAKVPKAPRKAAPSQPPAPVPQAATPAPAVAAAPSGPAPKYNDVMSAVLNRDHAGAAEALAAGIWVDRVDSTGTTPLMAAAENGDAAMVQLLLNNGADLNRIGRDGSVLRYAERSRDGKTIDLLRKAGAR